MPELAGIPGHAAVQPTIEHQTAADPGRDREVDEVVHAARSAGPEPPFGEGTRGRVVLDDGRQAIIPLDQAEVRFNGTSY